MTAYHGGKQRIGNIIADIIYKEIKKIETIKNIKINGYCEPFCGMLGVYRYIPELFNEYNMNFKAGDLNKSVIMMWKELINGWKPQKNISEDKYNKLKKSKLDSALKGYVGHQYSFGGKYFKGYAPKYNKIINDDVAIKRLLDISLQVSNVEFNDGIYTQYSHLKNYIIYCDPPYDNTEQHYKIKFNSNDFYDWCRKMVKNNNILFISGYNAPKDFKIIFKKENKLTGISPSQIKKKSTKKTTSKNRIEKLYVLY